MWPDHHQIQIPAGPPIGKQAVCVPELELVNEYAPQIAFLFLPDTRIIRDSANFQVRCVLLTLRELLCFFSKDLDW